MAFIRSVARLLVGVLPVCMGNHDSAPRSPSRSRTLSCESGGDRESKLVAQTMASQTNTDVDRLARSGSAASLAVGKRFGLPWLPWLPLHLGITGVSNEAILTN